MESPLSESPAGAAGSLIDAIPANIALIDGAGRIVAVNTAWKRFAADNGSREGAAGIGASYLEACDRAAADGDAEAELAARGIRQVIAGTLEHFHLIYRCDSPREQRWFELRARRVEGRHPWRLLVSHEDITAAKLGELALRAGQRELEARLRARTADFERTRAALAKSSLDFQTIIDSSPLPVFAIDCEGFVTLWSPAAQSLLGWPAETAGQALPRLDPPGSHSLEDGLRLAALGNPPREFEASLLRRGGDTVDVLVSSAPMLDASGLPAGAICILNDITERKGMAKALEEQRHFLAHLAETTPDILCVFDVTRGRCVFVNDSVTGILGYSPEEILAMGPAVLRLMDLSGTPISAAPLEDQEVRFRHRNGDIRVVRVRSRTFKTDPSGAPEQILFSARDVTEQKAVETALAESEKRFSLLMDHLPPLVFLKDPDGRYVFANRSVGRITGRPAEEWVGRTDSDFWPPEIVQEILESDRKALAGSEVSAESTIQISGQTHHFRTLKFPVRDGQGRIVLVAGIGIDVTEQKRAEIELEEKQQQLRALAASLIQAEENERRRIARELHDDLNQQLAAIAMELGVCAREPAGGGLRKLQGRIVGISEAIRGIGQQLHPAILDDLGLVVALESYCEDFSRREQIKVRLTHRSVPKKLPQPAATCAYRVVQESLRNVARHACTASAAVQLGFGQGRLRLRVRDEGAGFDRQQVKGKGGLGLISMEERVRLAGGRIEILSEPGSGTEVRVEVPVREEE